MNDLGSYQRLGIIKPTGRTLQVPSKLESLSPSSSYALVFLEEPRLGRCIIRGKSSRVTDPWHMKEYSVIAGFASGAVM